MELSIGSYKCRLEVCLLIMIITWILFGHLFCSCSRVGMIEGFELGKQLVGGLKPKGKKEKFGNQKATNQKATNKKATNQKATNKKEGFKNASAGFNFADAKGDTYYKNPSTWGQSTSTASASANDILNRPHQPIPLPKDELDLFATTEFKPECCPNTYSTGSGCACMTVDQYKYLKNRGSNNIPFSEY